MSAKWRKGQKGGRVIDDADDSTFSCPTCGCEEVRWAAPMMSLMSSEAKVACSCRACGWVYLMEVDDGNGDYSGLYEVSK